MKMPRAVAEPHNHGEQREGHSTGSISNIFRRSTNTQVWQKKKHVSKEGQGWAEARRDKFTVSADTALSSGSEKRHEDSTGGSD